MLHLLAKKIQDEERQIRLINWGNWSNRNGTPDLDYPTWMDIWADYVKKGVIGHAVAEVDAQHLENIISTLYKNCLDGGVVHWGSLWCYILKIEFVWVPRAVEHRATMVSTKFHRPCASSTYHGHVARAKNVVFTFADKI